MGVPVAATLGGIFSMAYSLRFIHDVFFNGPPVNLPNPHPHGPVTPGFALIHHFACNDGMEPE